VSEWVSVYVRRLSHMIYLSIPEATSYGNEPFIEGRNVLDEWTTVKALTTCLSGIKYATVDTARRS